MSPEEKGGGPEEAAVMIWPEISVKGDGNRKIDLDDIYALASVDVKEKEPGLQELAQHLRVPFVVFSAGELKKVPGDFTASAFVAQTVGVDNVCERAAVAAADGGSLLIHKQAMDGVTIAVAKREKIVLQFV